MARALIVGCGCCGRELGRRLAAEGWAVRGTSRRPDGLAAIEAAGLQAAEADPERPGTILDLVGDVAVLVLALGSARGPAEQLEAIHGPRLERLLEHLVDTPVRGIVYEAAGTVPAELLAAGADAVRLAGRTWRIPFELPAVGRDDPEAWGERMAAAVQGLLAQPGKVNS